ncbi:polyadenylate-binding protein 3 [Biomphalaria glabrata]|nr:polyadenylate-binding protein 3-like [Biomphalaria glabrata]
MTSTTSTTQDLAAMLANMSAASLFVGELLPHVNEVILYKKFAPMGTVTSVKLCRDWVTGKSLCYAYVNFENPAEAEKAYRSLNYELLEGQPMRIMKSTRNPWLQKGGDCSCYHHHCCNNTKGFVDAKTIVEAIETYGFSFKNIGLQDTGETKAPTGYKYSSEFLKRMNNANNRFTNVFIKNFKDLLDDFKLWKLCKQFGEVTSAKVMLDEYGISKGFGFACFTDSDAAQRAVNKLNGLVLDGRTLYAGPAMTRTQRQRDFNYRYDNDDYKNDWRHNTNNATFSCSPRICIRNLRDIVDDIRLRKEFERFGPVLHAELLKTYDGRSKGIGYVTYKEQTDATKALNSMHGKVIYGTRISVTYSHNYPNISSNNVADNALTSGNSSLGGTGGSSTANPVTTTNTSNDGDNATKNLLQLKDLVSTLANKGHPVNINDISNFNGGNSVNRNSSNNIDNINTSNNAILAMSARKAVDKAEGTENGDVANGTEQKRSEQDASDDTTGTTATLSVKNLDESITDEKLESLFSVYGNVLSAKVISNEFGTSKGFGFVIMSDAQDAVRAIKNLDGRIVVNRPVYVAPTAQARALTKA